MPMRSSSSNALARALRWATIAICTSIVACDDNPDTPFVGDLGITTSMPASVLTTSDGWSVKVDRMFVNVSAVTVAGLDRVVAASATSQIVDQIAPGPKPLLTASVRTARLWDAVSLQVGPATTDSAVIDPVKEPDRDMMQKEGLSIFLQGSITKGPVTKALDWHFTTSARYADCSGEQNGVVVQGLLVPPNGSDTADVAMDFTVLFTDDLTGAPTAKSRADAIAAADTDNDGKVTTAELVTTPLDKARLTGGAYTIGDTPGVSDLAAFIDELSRRIVTSFRAKGSCKVQSISSAP
jgi:hypothetical protein